MISRVRSHNCKVTLSQTSTQLTNHFINVSNLKFGSTVEPANANVLKPARLSFVERLSSIRGRPKTTIKYLLLSIVNP